MLRRLVSSKTFAVVGVSALTLVGGFFAGVRWAKNNYEQTYAEDLAKEIRQTKVFYERRHKEGVFATPEEAVVELIPDEAAKVLKAYQGATEKAPVVVDTHRTNYARVPEVQPPKPSTIEERNAFVTAAAEVDIAKLIRNRTEEAPYLISIEEFNNNEEGFRQTCLTYYSDMGSPNPQPVLCDEREDVVEIDETIGLDNIPRFGVMSGDPRLLHVRNFILEMEFEVALHDGSYAKEVAGL